MSISLTLIENVTLKISALGQHVYCFSQTHSYIYYSIDTEIDAHIVDLMGELNK